MYVPSYAIILVSGKARQATQGESSDAEEEIMATKVQISRMPRLDCGAADSSASHPSMMISLRKQSLPAMEQEVEVAYPSYCPILPFRRVGLRPCTSFSYGLGI